MMQTKVVTLGAAANKQPSQKDNWLVEKYWLVEKLGAATTLGIVATNALALLLASSNPAQAAPVENWQYDPQSNQLTFVLPDGVKPRYFLMAQPARIVVDIPNTQVGDVPLEQEFPGNVKRISVSQLQPQLMRVILEMSPTAVFGRGQVKLDNIGDFGLPSKDQWVITPVLQGDSVPNSRKPLSAADAPIVGDAPETSAPKSDNSKVDTPQAVEPQTAQPQVSDRLKTIAPKPEPKPAEVPPGMESVVNAPLTTPTPSSAKPAPIKPVSQREPERVPVMQLPPAPPPIAAIPVGIPPVLTPSIQASIVTPPRPDGPAASVMPTPVSRPDLTIPTVGSSPLPALQPMVSVPPLATISASATSPLPRAVPIIPQQPTVSVPGLPPLPPLPATAAPATAAPPNQPTNQANQSGMPPLPTLMPSPTVVVANSMPMLPPVSPRDVIRSQPNAVVAPPMIANFGTSTPIMPASSASAFRPSSGVIDFGQPLPTGNGGPIASAAGIQALDNITTGGITVPAGNVLSLRYDRSNSLKLRPGQRQQEILVLQTPILDSTGRTVVPQGSLVLGDFDTDKAGSRFTARVLSTSRSNLSILAQSNLLQSNRQVSNRNLLQNSGIGAVAGAIVGGLGGSILGGAAAGAALTYATSPKETMIAPGQVVEVRLVQDFLASRY